MKNIGVLLAEIYWRDLGMFLGSVARICKEGGQPSCEHRGPDVARQHVSGMASRQRTKVSVL